VDEREPEEDPHARGLVLPLERPRKEALEHLEPTLKIVPPDQG
jgi:hypothetical protein